MQPFDRRTMLGAAGLAGVVAWSSRAWAGPPESSPGAPPVRAFDPRVPVQSLPGSDTALHVIREPGSYCFSGTLIGAAGMHGVEVRASRVTLDLCGFDLLGVPGSGVGILSESADAVAVLGGVVAGWGSHGVQFGGRGCGVRGMRALSNNGVGIHVATGGLVEGCTAEDNRYYGVEVLDDGSVLSCIVRGSREAGGILALRRCRVIGCMSSGNAREGIRTDQDGEISSNMCADNGGPGVIVGHGSRCVDNHCCGGPVGVACISNAAVLRNTCERCAVGVSVRGGRCFVAQNLVVDSATPYEAPQGGSCGPIVDVAGVGDISSVAGANHPWANFIY